MSETPREAIEDIPVEDLPYRIVEAMGLGYTFRSCNCGQLPCARLQPIRDALEVIRRDEQERCAKIAEDHRDNAYRLEEAATESRDRVIAAARASLARSIAAAIRGSKQ